MSWRDAGRLVLLIALANVAGLLWSRNATLGVWLLYILGSTVAAWLAERGWRRRIAKIAEASPDDCATQLADLAPDDQALARLTLGLVSAADARVDPRDGEIFRYPRTPALLLGLTFWASVAMSALPLALLVIGRVRADQIVWAFAVGIGFAIGAWAARWSAQGELTTIQVTQAGLVERKPSGHRIGILWSEIGSVTNRRFLLRVEVRASDQRRCIRIGYTLERFPRFMELLAAHLQAFDERAA